MENKEIELTDEELLFIKSLESKLNVTEYSELRNIINKYEQLARNKDWEAEQKEKRIKSARERADEYYEKYYKEKEASDRWKECYRELVGKYARQDIELDLVKAKIEILEGEKK